MFILARQEGFCLTIIYQQELSVKFRFKKKRHVKKLNLAKSIVIGLHLNGVIFYGLMRLKLFCSAQKVAVSMLDVSLKQHLNHAMF